MLKIERSAAPRGERKRLHREKEPRVADSGAFRLLLRVYVTVSSSGSGPSSAASKSPGWVSMAMFLSLLRPNI